MAKRASIRTVLRLGEYRITITAKRVKLYKRKGARRRGLVGIAGGRRVAGT